MNHPEPASIHSLLWPLSLEQVPEDLRAAESVDIFKSKLKTYLFNLAFNWTLYIGWGSAWLNILKQIYICIESAMCQCKVGSPFTVSLVWLFTLSCHLREIPRITIALLNRMLYCCTYGLIAWVFVSISGVSPGIVFRGEVGERNYYGYDAWCPSETW